MTKAMWGGRFEAEPSELLRRLNDSFAYDRELFAEDIEGSKAWARALAGCGALASQEAQAIIDALETIAKSGVPTGAEGQEDIHSFVEARLYELIGPLAGKLHTGRSRNDQVATDLKLWLKNAARELQLRLLGVATALASRAVDESATAMPGYTHSKQAEPITFGHWCLAYVEMLSRDLDRVQSMTARNDECPLGSAALSGTPLPIDRDALAHSLGFARASLNSIDGVADRDFAIDYLFSAAITFSHLSRMAEDLIFFTSDEAAYAELPDALATGSSRMPQKKNPDVLELVRGHGARSIGELTGLLALMKGLPLAYDKDLQLDKEPLFRTRRALDLALSALAALIEGLRLGRERMRAAASRDLLLATELADAIAARGIPFREAHEVVSARMGEALRRGSTLRELGPTESITAADLEALDVDRALGKHRAKGGTSPDRVRIAAQQALDRLKKAQDAFVERSDRENAAVAEKTR